MVTEQTEPSKHAPNFYVNQVKVAVSPYDVILAFGLRTPELEEPEPIVNIYMSPEHAWVMAKLLNRNMRGYVKQVGRISIPAGLLEELDLQQEYDEDMKGVS